MALAQPKTIPSLTQAQQAAAHCLDLKAKDVLLLDLRRISDATDFFLIASGTSDTHVRSIAGHVVEELRAVGIRPHHIEGLEAGRWVLVDYVDFVIHVFHPAMRQFYQLERLWDDAAGVALDAQGALA